MSDKIEVDRDLVVAADSMLSLLRHRGDIRNWGQPGFVEQYEVDYVIGQLRRAYEKQSPTVRPT